MKEEKIYIVTGATGFLGNNIVRELLKQNKRVRAFVRSKEKAARVFSGLELEVCYGDITDTAALDAAFYGAEEKVLIHTAGKVTIGNESESDLSVNIEGTLAAVSVCKKHNSRLVYISSVHAIPESGKTAPIYETDIFHKSLVKGAYAKTKAEATRLVMQAHKDGLDCVILHPSAICGPRDYSDSYLTKMVIDYNAGRIPAAVKGGYDFVDVRDAAQAVIAACSSRRAESGSCYLLTGNYCSVRGILESLYSIMNKKRIRLTLPIWTAYLGLPFLTLYARLRRRQPLYTAYSLYTLNSNANFVSEKARLQLGFTPRPVYETLKDTVAFLTDNGLMSK